MEKMILDERPHLITMDILFEKLKVVFSDVLNIKYSINTFNNKAHEQSVQEVLDKHGIRQMKGGKNINNILYYEKEPNGSQRPPDLMISYNNIRINIECKSCKSGYKPMWNASYPSNDTIYIYTNKTRNNTLVFVAEEVISKDIVKIYEDYKKKTKELEEMTNIILKDIPDNNYKLTVYARNMFTQNIHLNENLKDEYFSRAMMWLDNIIKMS